MVNQWLPVVLDDGSNLEARSQMLLASHMAGRAFSSGTGLGLCHGLAHSIPARTHAAHGVALTVVLPHVLKFNLSASLDKLVLLASPMGVANSGGGEEDAVPAIKAIEEFSRKTIKEQTLTELGATEDLVPGLVEDIIRNPVLDNTLRMPNKEEVREILISAL